MESDEVVKISCNVINSIDVYILPSCRSFEIIDDDVAIDCKSARVNENDGHATITFKRTGATSLTANIYCTTSDGTANHSTDYIHKNTFITFGPGESQKTFTIPIVDDKIVESDEVLYINCTTNNTNVDFLPSCLTNNLKVEIMNDDIHLNCLNATIQTIERSKDISITVKKEGLLHLKTTFWVETADGTALANSDYEPMTKKEFTFATGEKYLTFNVEIVDDNLNEKNESFSITIGADKPTSNYPTYWVKENCSTVLILDDDDIEEKMSLLTILLSFGVALIGVGLVTLAVFACCIYCKIK